MILQSGEAQADTSQAILIILALSKTTETFKEETKSTEFKTHIELLSWSKHQLILNPSSVGIIKTEPFLYQGYENQTANMYVSLVYFWL